jgi:hypothetical protein
MTRRSWAGRATSRLAALTLVLAAACADASEGQSCDLDEGDSDCETGLVCTPAHAVAAREAVCCPRPPTRPSSAECNPEVPKNHVSDPSIDGSFAAGGTGFGGSAGAPSGGAAGASGAGDGSGGAAGQAGSSAVDAADDAPADSGAAGADAGVG